MSKPIEEMTVAEFQAHLFTPDLMKVRCLDCGWLGHGDQLKAQACPECDGRVGEEGSSEYPA